MSELRIVTADELNEIIRKHLLWLQDSNGGERADLSSADLRSANLRSANLSYANLSSADLRYANLRSADLRSADLSYADLRSADLRSADLSSADLRSAENAILAGQDIRGYLFWATTTEDGVVVIGSGCRRFVGLAAAYRHWLGRHKEDPILHEDCLSLVGRIEYMAKVRGWKLEPESEAVNEPNAVS